MEITLWILAACLWFMFAGNTAALTHAAFGTEKESDEDFAFWSFFFSIFFWPVILVILIAVYSYASTISSIRKHREENNGKK